jgi:chromosome segregation ATPase
VAGEIEPSPGPGEPREDKQVKATRAEIERLEKELRRERSRTALLTAQVSQLTDQLRRTGAALEEALQRVAERNADVSRARTERDQLARSNSQLVDTIAKRDREIQELSGGPIHILNS